MQFKPWPKSESISNPKNIILKALGYSCLRKNTGRGISATINIQKNNFAAYRPEIYYSIISPLLPIEMNFLNVYTYHKIHLNPPFSKEGSYVCCESWCIR